MKLRVSGGFPIVVGHKLRLPGEEFEVPDRLGMSLLEHSGVIDQVGAVSDTKTADVQAQPTQRVRRRTAKPDSEGAE